METEHELYSRALELLKDYGDPEQNREADHRFIEVLTFTQADEIIACLDQVLTSSFIDFPVWARNLAYRLAVLQRPDDSNLLRRAAADLLTFGPDWDEEAEAMIQKADRIDSQSV